ncbi:hypothetical protein JTB14_022112 [Gonioctena quinquepunctata]|nr:hypothetical protein JTB14_022112 [Gonioctena quinquepunctata]
MFQTFSTVVRWVLLSPNIFVDSGCNRTAPVKALPTMLGLETAGYYTSSDILTDLATSVTVYSENEPKSGRESERPTGVMRRKATTNERGAS